jgi:hypothetical protein
MLINNDFAFLPIPKNASTSVVYSILQWRIKVDFGNEQLNREMIEQLNDNKLFVHYHTTYDYIKNTFPNKKIMGIRRPSADRFLSTLRYMIFKCKENNITLKYDFQNLNESEIIEIFTKMFYELSFITIPNFYDRVMWKEYENKINVIIKENITTDYLNFDKSLFIMFQSQYLWGLNKCDMILDISNLNELVDMIKKIKPNFNLIKINDTTNVKLNIEKSDKIIEFVDKVVDYRWLNESN